MSSGRVTLPIQRGLDDKIPALLARLGADAVRNSDGTELPEVVHDLAARVYATYFVARGDQEWALAHPDHRTQVYLMSRRSTAHGSGPLRIEVLADYFPEQVSPDTGCDVARWWQVVDRTTGEEVDPGRWAVVGTGAGTVVELRDPVPHHVYTVGFLAHQTWDSTQMYNYLTNDWAEDPTRVKEQPYDVRHEETWAHVRGALDEWLAGHPEVDVVRFTTFFYHFTLVYGRDGRERFVDWFGYSASVSVLAMEAFEAETGIRLVAEDFVDGGYYNSPFRVPSDTFRTWIDVQSRFVTSRVAEIVEATHAAGKEAMMFLGDNWIGTEPYGPYFASTGIDAVVGSVGSAATCRMISDIPGVRYTEGRFLPYFFPDVFHPGGDPVAEARESWLTARRAIVRSPLDRIGYGGYLSLALENPGFVDCIEQICDEFREIHDLSGGRRPAEAPFTVGIVNAWGALRSWQTHMVAHALWYKQAYSYLGVVEALAGLPLPVRFLTFDEVRAGVPEDVEVLVNAGAAGTAFSGGDVWLDESLQTAVRAFVSRGGGLVGIGEPTAAAANGTILQLSDVLGVDRETGWSLSTTRRETEQPAHFVTADLPGRLDVGEGAGDVVAVAPDAQVLRLEEGSVRAAVHAHGDGRAVYLAGLPYSTENARLLHRAVFWAAGREQEIEALGWAQDARVEVAWYPEVARALVYNSSHDDVRTAVRTPLGEVQVDLAPGARVWIETKLTSDSD